MTLKKKKSLVKKLKRSTATKRQQRTSKSHSRVGTGDKERENQTYVYLKSLKNDIVTFRRDINSKIISIPMKGVSFDKRQFRQNFKISSMR